MKHILSILFLLALLAGCSPRHHYEVDRDKFPVKGIDVSAHNGTIDFERVVADSVSFVYIKASEGTDFCDAMFERNLRSASDAGLWVGAYHFFRFDSPGHLQAYNLLNTVGEFDLDLPLAIDVEEWTNADDMPTNTVVEQLASMVSVLEAAGYRVVFYTNKQGYNRYIAGFFSKVPVWLCSLEGEPKDDWTLWQHSHEGRVQGMHGPVDINTFNGSAEEFRTWLVPRPQKAAQEETPEDLYEDPTEDQSYTQ